MSLYFESKTTGIHTINDRSTFIATLRKFDDMLMHYDDLFRLTRYFISNDYMFRPADCNALIRFIELKLKRTPYYKDPGYPYLSPLNFIDDNIENLTGHLDKYERTEFYNIIANILEQVPQHSITDSSYEFCKKYYPDIVK